MSEKENFLFEYKILIYDPIYRKDRNKRELEELDYLGINGWELVSVIELDRFNYNNEPEKHHKYIFKRRIFER
jgi:hypothetical protein